jgi:hypothetical protein
MNERVFELAKQATSIQGPTPYNPLTFEVFDKEKFAELIVKECCNILDPGEHQLIARFQARKWLQEHFGVEE